MRLTLTDGSVEIGKKVALRFQDTYEHTIPLTSQQERDGAAAHPSHMRLCLVGAAQEQRERIRRLEQSLAADAAEQLLTGDFAARRRALGRATPGLGRSTATAAPPGNRAVSAVGQRLQLPGVCDGRAPLAIRRRNSDLMTTFGICFLPILVVYYPLFAYGLNRAKNGALPPYCVWLGNVVCLAIGAWLLRKVGRY